MTGLVLLAHTDGSCYPNPGPGGWGAILDVSGQRLQASASEENSTNNRMELSAAMWVITTALTMHSQRPVASLTVVSDSQYVVNGSTTWLPGWQKKQFRGVANADLWLTHAHNLAALVTAGIDYQFQWVKGHAGHPDNELVDDIAGQARTATSPLTIIHLGATP